MLWTVIRAPLLFLALLPQFTDPTASCPVPMQIIALGLLHAFSCGVVYQLVGFGSRIVLQARPVAAQVVSRLSEAVMVIIAVLLLIDQLSSRPLFWGRAFVLDDGQRMVQ